MVSDNSEAGLFYPNEVKSAATKGWEVNLNSYEVRNPSMFIRVSALTYLLQHKPYELLKYKKYDIPN